MTTHYKTHQALSASTLIDTPVKNRKGEDLGKIEELMIDLSNGRISYAVLSFGGFLGIGDKFFAIPWEALSVDTVDEKVILDVDQQKLENAPGFDKDNWPQTADTTWLVDVYKYYGYDPYWS
jgi:sporulation protein YlmC with PRC-barrel domain